MLPDYVDVVRRSTTSNALDPVLPRSILSVTERPQMVVLLVVPGPFWTAAWPRSVACRSA
jgi:hypothetical protein